VQSVELKRIIQEEPNTDFEVRSLDLISQHGSVQKHAYWHYLSYLIVGVLFGIFLVKAEVISWFRIQEMFRFQSFHMYGVIGSAVVVGVISVWLIKKYKLRTIYGEPIVLYPKRFHMGQVIGGILFGSGWALTGACPGPLYAQIGTGVTVVVITLLSAIAGTWVYGLFRQKLPH
jgi:uncharacterized membrane protein YedE/YeeE